MLLYSGDVLRFRPLTFDGLKELSSKDRRFEAIGDVGPQSIEEAYAKATGTQWAMPLVESTRRNFKVYYPAETIDQLLVAAATLEFRRITKVKQSNRHQVIATVLEMLAEGLPYIVHRFDIRSFYESIPRPRIEGRLVGDIGLPRTAIRIIQSLFRGCDAAQLPGLPRGIGISASLSEDFLRPIDRAFRLHKEARLYCRYVDDMLLVSGTDLPHSQLRDWVQNLLFERGRLSLNETKSCGVIVDGRNGSTAPVAFEFLGYRFEMQATFRKNTEVYADIANSKVSKIKTKACLAATAYLRDRDEDLLRDRIKALTANYVLPGDHPHHPPRVGIYYSYPRITQGSYESGSLHELDQFIRQLFLGRSSKLSFKIRSVLPDRSCSDIARLSFVDGHRTRRLEQFDSRRIGRIVECWKHV